MSHGNVKRATCRWLASLKVPTHLEYGADSLNGGARRVCLEEL